MGSGAGFYVDATQTPWQEYYQMYSYVTRELPALIADNFSVQNKQSIMGHSMGGTWSLNLRAQESPTISIRIGICTHSRADAVSLG